MKLIYQGAEAELFKDRYFEKETVIKNRIAKTYRRKELDLKIRQKRTKQECFLLNKARKAGIRTPIVFKVDKKSTTIVMEFIKGKKLRDYLNKKNISLCKEIGTKIAKLHLNSIIHGDLTTSNMIVMQSKEIAFVDFGLGFLSNSLEDKAVDLLAFKKTFNSTHFQLKNGWQLCLNAYLKIIKNKKVAGKIKQIEKRTRYS